MPLTLNPKPHALPEGIESPQGLRVQARSICFEKQNEGGGGGQALKETVASSGLDPIDEVYMDPKPQAP